VIKEPANGPPPEPAWPNLHTTFLRDILILLSHLIQDAQAVFSPLGSAILQFFLTSYIRDVFVFPHLFLLQLA